MSNQKKQIMKTANPNIDIFNDLKKAERQFEKENAPCAILQGYGSYFVDRKHGTSESALKAWPRAYKLIREK